MTTMSVMVALLPIASGLEEGSELLQAAAVVLIGGLLTSTLLTLVFVPAMYTIFDDMQAGVVSLARRLSGRRAPASAPPTSAHEAIPASGQPQSAPVADRLHAPDVRLPHERPAREDGHADRRTRDRPDERSESPAEEAAGPRRR
jgi:HAE1 family hydrophobic/amphiphilic exporter-1